METKNKKLVEKRNGQFDFYNIVRDLIEYILYYEYRYDEEYSFLYYYLVFRKQFSFVRR